MKFKEKTYYDDLKRVGPSKPLGHLDLDRIRDINNEDPESLMLDAKSRGLYAKIYSEEESGVVGGALFVADLYHLQILLQKNITLLIENGWPTEPVAFIEKAHLTLAPWKTPLFDLIADAYADYTNPGRSDIDGW